MITRKKNRAPTMCPPGMDSKTMGRVTNMSPGPELISPPNATTDGIIISPARIATPVSTRLI